MSLLPKLNSLAINVCVSFPNPDSLISLISQNSQFPPTFLSFLRQGHPEIISDFNLTTSNSTNNQLNNKDSISNISNLPPLLRLHLIEPPPDSLDTPRLCILARSNSSCINELYNRAIKETDPKLLHDILLASPMNLPLPNSLPFKLILLSSAARDNPNLTPQFIANYFSIAQNNNNLINSNVVLTAAHALHNLAAVNAPAVVKTFSATRILIRKTQLYSSARSAFMDSLQRATGAHMLDGLFVWREYHNIHTIDDLSYNFPDLLHYTIISLFHSTCLYNELESSLQNNLQSDQNDLQNDQNDSFLENEKRIYKSGIDNEIMKENEMAELLLLELLEKDRTNVSAALRRLPENILVQYPKLIQKIQRLPQSLPSDELPKILIKELNKLQSTQSIQTTQLFLRIASAIVMFPESASKIQYTKNNNSNANWINLLADIGNSVYDFYIPSSLFEFLLLTIKDNQDYRMRFASAFSLAILASHHLIPSNYSSIIITESSKNISEKYSEIITSITSKNDNNDQNTQNTQNIQNKDNIVSDWDRLFLTLLTSSQRDAQPIVRLISCYGLTYFSEPSNAFMIVRQALQRAESKKNIDDLFGAGYLLSAWFSECISDFNSLHKAFSSLQGLSSHFSELSLFLGKTQDTSVSNDLLSLGQWLYLCKDASQFSIISKKSYDNRLDSFLKSLYNIEDISCSLFGYVPEIAFRTTDFSSNINERDKLIISSIKSSFGDLKDPDSDLIIELITRQRQFHPIPDEIKQQIGLKPSIEIVKENWNSQNSEDKTNAITAVSN